MGTRQSNKGTEYTERGILDILNRQFLVSPRWIVNNLYVYNWESDYLAITRSMYAYEVEVKISLADYNRDFEKEGKHQVMQGWFEARKQALYETGDWVRYGCPNYFYYCVPDGLVDPKDIPPYAGLAYVCGRNLRKVKDAPILHRDKFDPEAYKMADKFYYNWWNERRKARQIEGKDMKDEFRKSMKKVKEKITVDAKIRAMEAFRSVCDYAYWPYGGRGVPGMRPNCSACGEECKLQCPKGKEFKNKIK